jgi:hypothetical protein
VWCLSLVAGDIDDSQLSGVVSVLFPELLTTVASRDAYEPSVQRKALNLVHSSIATLGVMSGMYPVSLSLFFSGYLVRVDGRMFVE